MTCVCTYIIYYMNEMHRHDNKVNGSTYPSDNDNIETTSASKCLSNFMASSSTSNTFTLNHHAAMSRRRGRESINVKCGLGLGLILEDCIEFVI